MCLMVLFVTDKSLQKYGKNVITLQEHQRIRTFAIYQTFLTLKFVLWAMGIVGNIHIFKHPAYVSKDLGEIYI